MKKLDDNTINKISKMSDEDKMKIIMLYNNTLDLLIQYIDRIELAEFNLYKN